MAIYRLKLKKFELVNVNYFYVGAFRLRVEASDDTDTGTDPNVFLYQRNLPNPYDGTVTDILLGVASVVDMVEYPVGEPDPASTYPFFRLAHFEVDLRAVALADQLWTLVQQQVNRLLLTLNLMEDKLGVVDEVWVGEAEEVADSDSSASA